MSRLLPGLAAMRRSTAHATRGRSRALRGLSTLRRRTTDHSYSRGILTAAQAGSRADDGERTRYLWVKTRKKDTFTASIEAGVKTFLFQESDREIVSAWTRLASFEALLVNDSGEVSRSAPGSHERSSAERVGQLIKCSKAEDIEEVEALSGVVPLVVMDCLGLDWKIIPAENAISAFSSSSSVLVATASTAAEGLLMLEALEVGTDGVVLCTDDANEVRTLYIAVQEMNMRDSKVLLQPAKVVRVEPLGMGERVAVDTCELMQPGEGLLVGSFSRGLFLVQSESATSEYVPSRPFRVNAGAVHSYVAASDGNTQYLSEVCSGSKVAIVNESGHVREALVGRSKIERRPLVLVEAELDHQRYSVLLQNAETVRIVGPGDVNAPHAIPVSDLKPGVEVYVSPMSDGGRHIGRPIHESICEK
mmetsp:Transcript_527/g.1886  ORF Transcript_527/g.1886 Transcript_527/m.1886 type:complete len:420 (+) Transcript_527:112-1371(+)